MAYKEEKNNLIYLLFLVSVKLNWFCMETTTIKSSDYSLRKGIIVGMHERHEDHVWYWFSLQQQPIGMKHIIFFVWLIDSCKDIFQKRNEHTQNFIRYDYDIQKLY